MTPNDTDDMHDDLSDKKLSNLYREAAKEEPPMKLDSAVLLRARKAVEKRRWWQRAAWIAPLATVAVAMLTVSLVIQMKQQHPEAFSPDKQSAPASIEEAVPTSQGLMKEQKREAEDAMKRKSASPAPAMSPALRMAPTAPAETEPKQEYMNRSKLLESAPAPEGAAGFSSAASMADTATEDMAAEKAEAPLPPEEWIAKIRDLLKQGKKDETRKELEAFKVAWPDYELPDDLD